MLDTEQRHRKETGCCRIVVPQKNDENIMDIEKIQRRGYGNGRIQTIPTKNNKKETNEIPGTHLQEEWDRETDTMLQDRRAEKQRTTTNHIHR